MHFPRPPLQAGLSISTFRFLFVCARKVLLLIYTLQEGFVPYLYVVGRFCFLFIRCRKVFFIFHVVYYRRFPKEIPQHQALVSTVFRSVRKMAKSRYQLRHVCLSVRMEPFGSHWTDFHEILYLNIFRESVEVFFFICVEMVTQPVLHQQAYHGIFTEIEYR